MVTGPELTSPRAARVQAARRLAKRAFRARDRPVPRRGTAGGARGARPARHGARALRHPEAADAARRDRRRRRGRRRPGPAGQRRGDGRAVADRDAAGPGRGLPPASTARCRAARLAGRGWSPCSPHARDPGNAGTVLRTADAAGAGGGGAHRRQRRPLQRQVRAGLGRQPVPPAGEHRRPASRTRCRALRAAGLRVLAADGHGDVDLDEAADSGLLAGPTAWVFGNEAWGLPRRPGRWPTPSSGSRSTAAPRA